MLTATARHNVAVHLLRPAFHFKNEFNCPSFPSPSSQHAWSSVRTFAKTLTRGGVRVRKIRHHAPRRVRLLESSADCCVLPRYTRGRHEEHLLHAGAAIPCTKIEHGTTRRCGRRGRRRGKCSLETTKVGLLSKENTLSRGSGLLRRTCAVRGSGGPQRAMRMHTGEKAREVEGRSMKSQEGGADYGREFWGHSRAVEVALRGQTVGRGRRGARCVRPRSSMRGPGLGSRVRGLGSKGLGSGVSGLWSLVSGLGSKSLGSRV
eukprot:1876253-Rhodomonas_salina.1